VTRVIKLEVPINEKPRSLIPSKSNVEG